MTISDKIKGNAAKTVAQPDGAVIRLDGFPEEISQKLTEEIQKVAAKMKLTPNGKPIKCGEKTELRFMKMAKDAAAGK